MINQEFVESIVSEFISSEYPEHYIVDVSVYPGNRIVVELGVKGGISVDDCVRITKYIESKLDRDQEDFELEVGSAGITSAFKVMRQYEDALGEEVEVLVKGGIKEKGILQEVDHEKIQLVVLRRVKLEGAKRKTDVEELLIIPMEQILQTKRVLSF